MHPGYEIPRIQNHNKRQQQQQQQQQQRQPHDYMNQPHNNILEQIHTQQMLLDPHHYIHQPRYMTAAGVQPAFFPVNFQLGLNHEGCCTSETINSDSNKNGVGNSNIIIGGEANLFRGSEQYDEVVLPEARQTYLGLMNHCWQNQQDSGIKQPRFWEPLAPEASNENSEIIDRRETENQRETAKNCFGELEAIYKRHGTVESFNQRTTNENPPVEVNAEASDHSLENERKKKKKKKKKKEKETIINYTEFFEKLVKQVVEHQQNLHKKFAEVIERLEGERREREERWRNEEMTHFVEEAEVRAREKAMADSREATIVSYLEKITGERINLPSSDRNKESNSTNPSGS